MKIPTSIKIANHIFTVVVWDTNVAKAHDQFGLTDCNNLTIKIDTSYKDSHTKETLMHEILHAIYWVYGIDDTDKEERIITAMAVGLSQVWQDNPSLYTQMYG